MAYEAYTAAVNHIAEQVYKEWRVGAPCDQLLVNLAKESNVEAHHCRRALSQHIHAQHLNNQLVRENT